MSTRVLLLGACLALLPGALGAQDWPQFRGPDGLAVSTQTDLPLDFSPDGGSLRWAAEIPGTGISSPIVSNGRVFVTTAYPGVARSRIEGLTTAGMIALALLALGAAARRTFSRRPDVPDGPKAPLPVRALAGLDTLSIALATLAYTVLALVITLEHERIWSPGIPGDAWLVTSTVGLVGLVAAIGWFAPRSPWRAIGAGVLLAAGWMALRNLPLNKHHEVYKLSYRVVMVAPAAAGALWHLLVFLVFRLRQRQPARASGALVAATLAAMTVLLFVSRNFVNPEAGLMRALVCLDLQTGERLWDRPFFVAPEERLHRLNTFATPTPCTDGETVLARFGPGYACVDFEGRVLWEGRDEDYVGASHYGAVSSPIAFEDTYILLQEAEMKDLRTSFMMALDKEDGSQRWRIEPDYAYGSYMTPLLMPVGGTQQLVIVTWSQVVGFDPRTGERLWSQELPTWQHVPSLTFSGDLLFVSGGAHEKWVTAALRLQGSGKDTRPEVLWQTTRNVPHSASPILYQGAYLTLSSAGILVCYEPETGRELWKQRLDGSFLASLVAADGGILACSDTGEVFVLRAGTEFELLSRSDLGETILATPALAQGNVLIRGERHLFCFASR